jgi:hypothetical protein
MFVRSFLFATALVAIAAMAPAAQAQAPSGTIQLHLVKGSYFIGGMGGHGTLQFNGRSYPVSVGGVSIGLSIGGAVGDLAGEVYNLASPYDIEGVYGAATASWAVAHGQEGTSIHNARGVVIHLHGPQVGLEFSLDVSGIVLHLR